MSGLSASCETCMRELIDKLKMVQRPGVPFICLLLVQVTLSCGQNFNYVMVLMN